MLKTQRAKPTVKFAIYYPTTPSARAPADGSPADDQRPPRCRARSPRHRARGLLRPGRDDQRGAYRVVRPVPARHHRAGRATRVDKAFVVPLRRSGQVACAAVLHLDRSTKVPDLIPRSPAMTICDLRFRGTGISAQAGETSERVQCIPDRHGQRWQDASATAAGDPIRHGPGLRASTGRAALVGKQSASAQSMVGGMANLANNRLACGYDARAWRAVLHRERPLAHAVQQHGLLLQKQRSPRSERSPARVGCQGGSRVGLIEMWCMGRAGRPSSPRRACSTTSRPSRSAAPTPSVRRLRATMKRLLSQIASPPRSWRPPPRGRRPPPARSPTASRAARGQLRAALPELRARLQHRAVAARRCAARCGPASSATSCRAPRRSPRCSRPATPTIRSRRSSRRHPGEAKLKLARIVVLHAVLHARGRGSRRLAHRGAHQIVFTSPGRQALEDVRGRPGGDPELTVRPATTHATDRAPPPASCSGHTPPPPRGRPRPRPAARDRGLSPAIRSPAARSRGRSTPSIRRRRTTPTSRRRATPASTTADRSSWRTNLLLAGTGASGLTTALIAIFWTRWSPHRAPPDVSLSTTHGGVSLALGGHSSWVPDSVAAAGRSGQPASRFHGLAGTRLASARARDAMWSSCWIGSGRTRDHSCRARASDRAAPNDILRPSCCGLRGDGRRAGPRPLVTTRSGACGCARPARRRTRGRAGGS